MPSPQQGTPQSSNPVDDFADIAQAHPAAQAADDFSDIAQMHPVDQAQEPRVLPLPRTPGNYAAETAYGIGRGLKNDVMGLATTALHPINAVTGLYGQTKDMLKSGQEAYNDEQTRDPKTGAMSRKFPGANTILTMLEKAPVVGGMVQKAEEGGDKLASPESVGAAAEGITTFGAPELLGKGMKSVAKSDFVTQAIPRGLINNLIRPAAADVKFGKNPAQAILGEGLVGNTLRQLGDNTYARLNDVGKQLDALAKDPANATKVVDLKDALNPIDDAMADATKAGRVKLYDALASLKIELSNDFKQFRDVKGNMSIRPKGLKTLQMSPEEALDFKRDIGDRIRWDGTNPFGNELNTVNADVYGNIKDALNSQVPGLKDLNTRYSDLVGAAKAIERRTPVAERNAAWSLSDIAMGATGHLPMALVRKALGTPAVRTRMAQYLYNFGQP